MKKKNIFLRSLLIYCLILIVVIAAGLFVLTRFLVSYEASRPDNTVEEFVSERERSFWINGLQELIDQGFNEFTKTDGTLSDFGIDENAPITYRSNVSEKDDELVYDVRLGSARICSLLLRASNDVGFGLNSWVVSDWEFTMPGGADISISVPTDCSASINGIQVGSGYLTGMGNISLSLEQGFDIAPSAEIYEIKGMIGPAEIKAYDALGNELEANFLSPTQVEFLPEPAYSFSFCTTEDTEVYINGVEISGELCTPVDLGLDGVSSILRYECDGLYGDPEISVTYKGETVKPLSLPLGRSYIPGASKTIEGDMADFLEGFIYAYVDFSANKNRSAEANFSALAAYLLPESELYSLTAATIENIAWASTSDLQYNSIDYSDLIPLGDGSYVCSIAYDISYVLGSNQLDVETGNLILIQEKDGRYYVSAMSAALE